MKQYIIATVVIIGTILHAGNYTRTDHNTVIDHDTGLEWQDLPYSDADKAAYNSPTKESNRVRKWIHAQAYCDSLGNGWRLGTIHELEGIVDKNYLNPAMDPIFKNGMPYGFWSSTPSPTIPNTMQGMGFAGGNIHQCGKDTISKYIRCVHKVSEITPPVTNNPPTANAGSDQSVIEGEMVTLDGSASTDPDGSITAYQWQENNAVLSNEKSFDKSDFSVGIHTLTLIVTDNEGVSDSDTIDVTIKSSAPANKPDWFETTEIDGDMEYMNISSETSVVLDSTVLANLDITPDNEKIVFKAKTFSNEGGCRVSASIVMKSDGKIEAGYEGNSCSDDIDTFTPGTKITIGSDMVLRIDTPLTQDLVLGGK